MSQMGQYTFTNMLQSIAGNTGDIVYPQVGNVNIIGSGHISTNGNNTTATLTIALDGGIADTYTTDSGNAAPVLGVIRFFGGDNLNSVGTGNTVTYHLDTSIVQPVTNSTGTEGLYSLGANRFMHNRGTLNTFLGQSAGSLSLTVATATNNVGIGANSLTSIATSSYSTAIGFNSLTLATGGVGNTTLGSGSGSALLTGSGNTIIAKDAGSAYVGAESNNIIIGNAGVVAESNKIRLGTYGTGAGQQDTAYIAGIVHASNGLVADLGDIVATAGNITATLGSVGAGTTVTAGTNLISTAGNLKLPTTSATVGQIEINDVPAIHFFGTANTFVGTDAGNFTFDVTKAVANSAFGSNALRDLVGTSTNNGNQNTALGAYAMSSATNSRGCVAIGYSAGSNYSTTESFNIDISSLGVAGTSNSIHIGGGTGTGAGQQDKCYISGIYGGTSGATAGLVGCDSVNKLYSISGTSGQVLLGGTKPAFSTATYPATITKGDILAATSDNVIGVIAGATTAGYVLTANGATSVPTFQAISIPSAGIQTLAGDSGTATGSTVTIAGGSNITTSATSATVTVDLDNSITLSGDVTALNLKTSTAATNLTINGNSITAGGSDTNVDLNFITKGTGGWTYDGIAAGWASSQWQMRQSSVQTLDATVTTLVSIPLLEGEMVIINDTINGFQSDFSDALGATVSITAYRPTGGNVTQIGEEIINVNSTSTADVTADVSVGTQSVIIEVKGVAAETWNWVSTHQYMFTKTNA